jgi:hypothetical protein
MKNLNSILNRITEKVFCAKNLVDAKIIFIKELENSKIDNIAKNKMLFEIDNIKSLVKLQSYLCNALLRFEGLSVNKYKK